MESKKWMGKQRKWEKEEERREGCEKMEERKGELRFPYTRNKVSILFHKSNFSPYKVACKSIPLGNPITVKINCFYSSHLL